MVYSSLPIKTFTHVHIRGQHKNNNESKIMISSKLNTDLGTLQLTLKNTSSDLVYWYSWLLTAKYTNILHVGKGIDDWLSVLIGLDIGQLAIHNF